MDTGGVCERLPPPRSAVASSVSLHYFDNGGADRRKDRRELGHSVYIARVTSFWEKKNINALRKENIYI